MSRAHRARLARMPVDQRDRVLERAAIIQEATGCAWFEADERALGDEVGEQASLRGMGDGLGQA
jgi:hypothetical protein